MFHDIQTASSQRWDAIHAELASRSTQAQSGTHNEDDLLEELDEIEYALGMQYLVELRAQRGDVQ